jgi:signal peptidase I
VVVVIALVASALLRAFIVQAFYVPTGSMLPEIQLHDKILVSRIGGIHRGEVVVFEDPGGWIPPDEKGAPPGPIRKAFEFIGLLPESSDDHLVKRVIGLPGDHVVCCNKDGRLRINGKPIDESDYLFQGDARADDLSFNVIVPAGHIFVLGDHRYDSGDSSRHLPSQGAFVPENLVTGRAMAVIWPLSDAHVLRIPDAFQDIPAGGIPPETGIVRSGRHRHGAS